MYILMNEKGNFCGNKFTKENIPIFYGHVNFARVFFTKNKAEIFMHTYNLTPATDKEVAIINQNLGIYFWPNQLRKSKYNKETVPKVMYVIQKSSPRIKNEEKYSYGIEPNEFETEDYGIKDVEDIDETYDEEYLPEDPPDLTEVFN